MKKNAIAILVILVVLIAGCVSSVHSFEVFDKITNAPFSGKATVNGKNVEITHGILKVRSQKIKITVNGYRTVETSDRKVYLIPKAYLIIKSNCFPDSVSINGSTKKLFILETGTYAISPAPPGKDKILLKSQFCKPFETTVNISSGKNEITVALKPDREKIDSFLSNSQSNNGSFTIYEHGKIDEDNINYKFRIVLENGKLQKIAYQNTVYEFKNGKVFASTGSEAQKEIINKEDVAALLFVKKTVENLFPLSKLSAHLPLISINGNKITLKGKRVFENREFYEQVEIIPDGKLLNKINLHLESGEIENANFDITIERAEN